jgi:mono/diheme cytochrome c family protein
VHDPVVCVFDADGSLWVVEMRGYMPDVDGKGETEPNGCVAHLFDDDGDGKMDRRVVFLDKLVLPRAIAPTRGGVLVIAPPRLLFAKDEDGDGVADEVTVVDQGLGGIQSPEWAINALLPTLDNAWYCANVPWRYVWKGEKWQRERTSAAGQWGATKDDVGRIYTNNNSDPLRVDAISGVYAARNPNMGNALGVNLRVVDDMSPRPARMNVGVNRGYQKGQLNGEWKLASVTGACAPLVHRGTGVGDEYRGDAFVCEPTGNLVLRYRLRDESGAVKGEPVRNPDGLDFLTSTDERFRPVWMCDGPDGALYVCDMYRGLIQHRLFVTSFLRKQVLARGLEKPIGMGRIWRVRSAKGERAKAARLDRAEVGDLVSALGSENGWTRDTAQRLLVEEHDSSAEAHGRLRGVAQHSSSSIERVHALWALAGMGGIRKELVHSQRAELQHRWPGGIKDPDTRVQLAAVATSEGLAATDPDVLEDWLDIARNPGGGSGKLRQVMLSLGSVPTPRGLSAMMELLQTSAQWEEIRSAAVSGLGGRELDALNAIADSEEWRKPGPGRAELIALLARCVAREARGDRLEGLIGLSAGKMAATKWQCDALVSGVMAGRPKDALGKPTWIRLARKPGVLPEALDAAFAWPGKAGAEEAKVRDLTAEENARFEKGRVLYEGTCVQCHLASGLGQTGQAPPLRSSPWVLGKDVRTARILLQGLRGEVQLEGERWDGEMPSVSFSDEDVAAILTYVRREWGHGAEPVLPATIARVREETKGRKEPWTLKELEGVER